MSSKEQETAKILEIISQNAPEQGVRVRITDSFVSDLAYDSISAANLASEIQRYYKISPSEILNIEKVADLVDRVLKG